MSRTDVELSRTDYWFLIQRSQEYGNQFRVMLLRIAAILTFYAIHLATHLSATVRTDSEIAFHHRVTWISAAWLVVSVVILIGLARRFFPRYLIYVTTCSDLLLLTAVAISGAKAASPLVVVYFLIVIVSGLSFRLSVVWFSTLGAMAAYLLLVGQSDSIWFDDHHAIPVPQQMIHLATILFCGIASGQFVRVAKRIALCRFEGV